mmetsp:Transcript_82665/g.124060  ORF Transcript_82665/g.124060 Transcript_82665/m.124060 type:complete len:103 (-) Transcript_82665:225-533(-)
MTLGEMRMALETSNEEPEEDKNERPKSRLPPERRGVGQSRSSVVEVDLPGGTGAGRKGTLTFANSVSELKRSGSSRVGPGGPPAARGLQRTAPQRTQSCAQG